MQNRRQFLNTVGQFALVAGGSVLLPRQLDAASFFSEEGQLHHLTILHTNDVHSRIEPFPMDGGKYQGRGGIARRAALIEQIRKEVPHVLLLDAGDMFQGTPYFNYFNGELELQLMSKMGYDVGTIGNHDFDAGLENLHEQTQKHANFPLVNCNYDFKNTALNGHIKPYKIVQKGPIKIGILGVGVELNGLVPQPLYGETQYLDPLVQANQYAAALKYDEGCDYVICLSHLGYQYSSQKVSDRILAEQSKNIDLIIGGHTHTYLEQPALLSNQDNKEVWVAQVGWAGLVLGRIDVYFERNFKDRCILCQNTTVG